MLERLLHFLRGDHDENMGRSVPTYIATCACRYVFQATLRIPQFGTVLFACWHFGNVGRLTTMANPQGDAGPLRSVCCPWHTAKRFPIPWSISVSCCGLWASISILQRSINRYISRVSFLKPLVPYAFQSPFHYSLNFLNIICKMLTITC